MDKNLPHSLPRVRRDIVTIRSFDDGLVHVTYNLKNGGIVELPGGSEIIPPQPTGFTHNANFVTISVTQSRNKSLTNVLYKSQTKLTEAALVQLGQQLSQRYQKCDVKINKTRKRRVKFRK